MIRSFILVAGALLAGEASAQSLIEPDAPERKIAGCYAADVVDSMTLFELPLSMGPDTVYLSLNADHYGSVIAKVQKSPADTIGEEISWREAGWRLVVRPDPYGGFHSFAHWWMTRDGEINVLGGTNAKSYRLRVRSIAPDTLRGELRRIENQVELATHAVELRRVSCPPNPFWSLLLPRRPVNR